TKQHQFGDVAEVEANAAPIRPAILADLVPDEIAFVGESPGFKHLDSFGQQGIRHPQIEVGRVGCQLFNRQRHDFIKAHRAVARQTLVFRCHLACAVLELPRRIGQDGMKAPAAMSGQQIPRRVWCRIGLFLGHDCGFQSSISFGVMPNTRTGQPPCLPALSRYRSLPIHVVLAPYFALTVLPIASPALLSWGTASKTGFSFSLRVTMTPALIRPHSWKARRAYKSRSKV